MALTRSLCRNTASEVLGVLIARASRQPLETFLRERIFDPLGMKDTSFSVPAAKRDRLATSYQPTSNPKSNSKTGALELYDDVDGQWSRPPAFPSAAGGLVSTIDDYFAFGRMMLNKGKFGRKAQRLLSRPSVEVMTTDQLLPEQKPSDFFPGFWDSRGWGFGVSVTTKRDDLSAVPGRFGWDGGMGTSWYSDPAEGLVAILMTQRLGFPLVSDAYLDFWTSVYAAIDD